MRRSRFWKNLTYREQVAIRTFFKALKTHVRLPEPQTARFVADFEAGLRYYIDQGLSVEHALARLDPARLGDFYKDEPDHWYPLDAAAKLYPLSMSDQQMTVFRLSATLDAPVVPALLQLALTFTIQRFPMFAATIKRGFFWHYIDGTRRRYEVTPERRRPCTPMNVSSHGAQCFRVVYFEHRISVEYFHILTDGTGGMVFLKTLVAEYLRLLGIPVPATEGVRELTVPAPESEIENAFGRAEKTEASGGFAEGPALQYKGKLAHVRPYRVLHFAMSAARLKEIAAAYDVTVTVLMLTYLMLAGRDASEGDGTLKIQVPVNLRPYYQPDTLRNFALYCAIRVKRSEISEFEPLLQNIKKQLAEGTQRDALTATMRSANRWVRILRFIPLVVKRPVARLVYDIWGDKAFSNTFSNLGVVRMK